MNRAYKYGKRSKRCIGTTTPRMQALCLRAMRIANRRALDCPDFGITSGLRTTAAQAGLYAIGRTKRVTERRVTNCDGLYKISIHQYGEAVDIVTNGKSDNGYNPGDLALVACCFFEAAAELKINIRWGGNFRSLADGAHIEIVG